MGFSSRLVVPLVCANLICVANTRKHISAAFFSLIDATRTCSPGCFINHIAYAPVDHQHYFGFFAEANEETGWSSGEPSGGFSTDWRELQRSQ